MNGKLLFDTNSVIALWAEEASVQQRLNVGSQIFVPSIVLGELYFGARMSAPPEANSARVDEFAANTPILACDTSKAQHYGRIRGLLRSKGRPIPDNDVWIASVAQQYGLTLVTRDEHFNEIEDLPVERW